MSPALEVRAAHFHYPGGIVGLDGATLALPAGEKVALLGPNGCGKTTLLLHLCGALRPQQGEIWLNGRSVEYSKIGLRELRRQVGAVLQDPDDQLFGGSVYQDVSFGPLNLGLPEAEVRERVQDALASLGIEDLAERPPHRLSLGQKKLAALAGVIAMHPQAIVLDEPTAALDPAGCAGLLAVLDQLHSRGTQITFATHDVDLAFAWADRVAVLCRGQVLACGAPDELFRRRDLLDAANLRTPWVLEVHRKLCEAEVLPAGETPPRSPEALLQQVANLRETTQQDSG